MWLKTTHRNLTIRRKRAFVRKGKGKGQVIEGSNEVEVLSADLLLWGEQWVGGRGLTLFWMLFECCLNHPPTICQVGELCGEEMMITYSSSYIWEKFAKKVDFSHTHLMRVLFYEYIVCDSLWRLLVSFFSYECIWKTAAKQPVVISYCFYNLLSMTNDLIGLVTSPPADKYINSL